MTALLLSLRRVGGRVGPGSHRSRIASGQNKTRVEMSKEEPTMKAARTTLLLAGLAGAVQADAVSNAAAAGEGYKVATLQPTRGMSFDVGSKRAISYFLAKDGNCRLTVLLADTTDGDGGLGTAPATRVQLRIGPGETARVDTAEGKALEFA